MIKDEKEDDMKNILLFLLIFLEISILYSEELKRTAIILHAKGTVEIFFSDGTVKANPNERNKLILKDTTIVGVELKDKDTVLIGSDGLLRLVFNNGKILELKGEAKLIIDSNYDNCLIYTQNETRKLSLQDEIEMCSEKVLALNLEEINELYAKYEKSERRFSELRPNIILLISPQGYISSSEPDFVFYDFILGSSEREKYTLIIVDGTKQEIFRMNIEEEPRKIVKLNIFNFIKFDAKESHSVYYWDIFKSKEEPENLEDYNFRGKFYLINKNKKFTVTNNIDCCTRDLLSGKLDTVTHRLLVALYLKKEKLYSEAIQNFEDFAKIFPNSPYPYEEIAALYSYLGLNYMSNKYIQKARVLCK